MKSSELCLGVNGNMGNILGRRNTSDLADRKVSSAPAKGGIVDK
jgi:hypothetical protein